ncbi:MAG: HAD-IIIA family hydrolase [Candidatus Omnitrophica bacterium]|nr:HAD-IIIA family hydrolase [Candidatus Omnitrophota bacterium]
MKIVFLDRDGVINQYPGHGEYVTRVKDLHIFPEAVIAIKRLKDAQYKVFIISNQACIGRGIITQGKLDQITNKLIQAADRRGITFDGIFYCTHHPDDQCSCRKPGIGNIKKAVASVGKTLSSIKGAFFVGDTDKDIETGYNAGLKTILVETGRDRYKHVKWGENKPHFVVQDLEAAAEIILNENSGHSRHRRSRA